MWSCRKAKSLIENHNLSKSFSKAMFIRGRRSFNDNSVPLSLDTGLAVSIDRPCYLLFYSRACVSKHSETCVRVLNLYRGVPA